MTMHTQKAVELAISMRILMGRPEFESMPAQMKASLSEQLDLYESLPQMEIDALRWRFVRDLFKVDLAMTDEGHRLEIDGDFTNIFDKVMVKFEERPNFQDIVDLMMDISVVTESENAMEKMMKGKL